MASPATIHCTNLAAAAAHRTPLDLTVVEQFIQDNLSSYGPVAVFLLLVLSGIGLALCEEMVTIPAGVFIATGELGFWPTAVAAYVGILIGDGLWFALCRHYGTPLLHRRLIKRFIHPRRLLQFKHQFEERGVWLIVLARFIPSSRTTAITVAGIVHMPAWRFLLATSICLLVTVPLQIGIGYLIGEQIGDPSLGKVIPRVIGLIMLIVVLTVSLTWWTRHRAMKHRAPRAKASWLRRFRVRRKTTAGSDR